ncbi:MAG: hypothetical protein KC609_00465, partial [Myxococcales bacterium]|nr:hypothetical protein [Myxococcales bacterium]
METKRTRRIQHKLVIGLVLVLSLSTLGAQCNHNTPAPPDPSTPKKTLTGVPGTATVAIQCRKVATGELLGQDATLQIGDKVSCTLRLENSPWFTRERFKKEGFAWTFTADEGIEPFGGLVAAPFAGTLCNTRADCPQGPC